MPEKFANNAATTLSLAISATQTSISVTSNDGFPSVTTVSGDYFFILVGTELMRVTNNPTTLWTVVRGVQSSTAASQEAGVPVFCVVTKQSMEDIVQSAVGSSLRGTYNARPAAGINGRIYYTTDSLYTFRDNGTSWEAFYQNRPVVIPPTVASLTWLNQGGATATQTNGAIDLQVPTSTGDNIRGLIKNYTTPFTLEVGIIPRLATVNFTSCGMIAKNSASNPLITNSLIMDDSTLGRGVMVSAFKLNSVTSFNSNYNSENCGPLSAPIYLKMTDDGTNRICEYSNSNGVFYRTVSTHSRTDFTTCNQMGVYANTTTTSATAGLILFHWKES